MLAPKKPVDPEQVFKDYWIVLHPAFESTVVRRDIYIYIGLFFLDHDCPVLPRLVFEEPA